MPTPKNKNEITITFSDEMISTAFEIDKLWKQAHAERDANNPSGQYANIRRAGDLAEQLGTYVRIAIVHHINSLEEKKG